MTGGLLDNSWFRGIYCNLAESEACRIEHGYVYFKGLQIPGLLPLGWEWLAFLLTGFAITMVLVNGVLGTVLMFIWAERRLLGRFQSRLGPNRWGPWGTLTPLADAIKTMFKEDIVPAKADRWVFNAAPVLMMIPGLLVLAVIPFGAGSFLADLNIGILYVIAVTSLVTFAIVMAGWGSQNRYAMFGAMRAVALLISYEIPMVLSLLGVLLLTGSLSLVAVVNAQTIPFILVQPLGFLVFFIASIAEINRPPFDLAEAESELGAGYHTEYSGMKFGLFLNAEFTATIVSAAVIVTLFLSGWRGFSWLPSQAWFFIKLIGVLFFMVWTRATWPRLRIDQVMAFAWKALLPLTFINLLASAIEIQVWPSPTTDQLWIMAGINFGVMIGSVLILSWLLGPRRAPSPLLGSQPGPISPEAAADTTGGAS